MDGIILHIDMDAFFASVEERENPRFRGKPVVVGADPQKGRGRGVVSTASYEARKYGIHSAMPISKAYQLCPQAVFLPVNMPFYQKVSERIMEIIRKYSPVFEQVSLDEAYLDISFLNSRKGAKLLAEGLKNEILEKEKLTATIGIGPNKLIAKMASEKAKPDGLLIIKANQVTKFLEELYIEKLPGIGPKTGEKLRRIGINKIKELKKLSKRQLKEMFGKVGESIYEKARGVDESPVTFEQVIKSVGKEHTFAEDTRDSALIFESFDKLIKELLGDRVSFGFSFRTITVVCRFQGFETHTKAKTFKEPTDNLGVLTKESKKLLLRFLLENKKPVRLIGLRLKIC